MSAHYFNCVCPYCAKKKGEDIKNQENLKHNFVKVHSRFIPTSSMKFASIFQQEPRVMIPQVSQGTPKEYYSNKSDANKLRFAAHTREH